MVSMEWSSFLVIVCCLISRTVGQSGTLQSCPSFDLTYPCMCNVVNEGVSLDCPNIGNDGELERVFQTSFQNSTLYEFILRDSSLKLLFTNVFGTTSFQRIILKNSFIQELQSKAFENSYSTLTYWELNFINISSDSLVFQSLNQFLYLDTFHVEGIRSSETPSTDSPFLKELQWKHFSIPTLDNVAFKNVVNLEKLYINYAGLKTLINAFAYVGGLQYLNLMGNNFTTLAASTFQNLGSVHDLDLSYNRISSLSIASDAFENLPTLQNLGLSSNEFVDVPEESLKSLPHLQYLNISGNLISTLGADTFSLNSNLSTLDLDYNNIQILNDNSFRGMAEQSSLIYLRNNIIIYISTATFGDISNSEIHLENNQLEILFESWLRPILEKNNFVYVEGNPYICDCAFSWILENPTFTSLLKGKCEEGTPFEDLDETFFQGC